MNLLAAVTSTCAEMQSYLEHLNEGNTEVQVGDVTANEGQREEETNWNNGPEVDSAGHWDLLARVESLGETGHDLGNEGGEGKMPCCKEDWVLEVRGV